MAEPMAEPKVEKSTSKSVESPPVDSNLEALGYRPELSRNRSTWEAVFMSFIVAEVPFTIPTTLQYPLAGGGPANMIWGWFIVCSILLCVVGSLAEITSVYPTAGGVYYQTFAVSPKWCRRVTAWICGWAYVFGNITITLSVNFGAALFLVAALNVFESNGVGITEDFQPYQTFLIFLAITLLTHGITAFGNRWLTYLEYFAIFLTFVGVIAMMITILVVADEGRHSGEWVFTSFEPHSGWPGGWSFFIGLLQAAYCTSGSGMITSMCEEVRKPETQVPKALIGGLVSNFVAGLAVLIPIAFILPDVEMLANLANGQPLPTILKSATGSSVGAFLLILPLFGLGIICGVTCCTATSRITWAFARDGALPGSGWFKQVNSRLEVPLNAMVLGTVIEIVLGCIYFGSEAAFSAFTGVGVILLTLSYGMPVAVSLLLRQRRDLKNAKFNLGNIVGTFANCVCIAWTCLAIPLFSMPTFIPVKLEAMNYASVVFVGVVAASALWYWAWGYKNYAGPPAMEDNMQTEYVENPDDAEKYAGMP